MPGIARLDRSIALRSLLALVAALLLCGALAGRADAGAWGSPFAISATGTRAEGIRLGADAAGDQFAVWQYEHNSEWVVQAAAHFVGESWSAPVDLSASAAREPNPALAVNSTGEALIAWSQQAGSNYVIQAVHGNPSNSWTSPQTLSSSATNSYEPAVGIDAMGGTFAAWRQYLGSNYGEAVSVEEGAGWTSPEVLSDPLETNEAPTLAVNPAGDAVVAWERSAAVEASNRPAGGSWSAATSVQTNGNGIADVQLAIDDAGETIAVWENAAPGGFSHWVVETARMEPDGSWALAEGLTSTADFSRDPSVAMTAGGEARAAWEFGAGGPGATKIATETSSAPATWSSPTIVSTSSDEAYEPHIAIDPLGNATVNWWGWDEAGHHYYDSASRMPAGGSWGPELALSEPGEEIYFPALAVDGTGGTLVAWSFWDESSGSGEETARTVGLDGARPQAPGGGPASGGESAAKTPTNPGPILCTAPSGMPSAASFIPVAQPGKTIPGVRARITVSSPSQVSVAATILYKQGGKSRSVDAGTYSMKVKDARNLKVPLPAALRAQLPVGSTVGVTLRIVATRTTSGCAGAPKIATKQLRLKVVRVVTGSH
jgi:hypothetical protein